MKATRETRRGRRPTLRFALSTPSYQTSGRKELQKQNSTGII